MLKRILKALIKTLLFMSFIAFIWLLIVLFPTAFAILLILFTFIFTFLNFYNNDK